MTAQTFLALLASYSVITGLVVEALKKLIKESKAYDIMAVATALIVGLTGTFIYYQLNCIVLTFNNVVYAILLGLASALVSMVGYDKVMQAIEQIVKKQ